MQSLESQSVHARLAAVERKLRVTVIAWVVSLILLTVLWVGTQKATSQTQSVRAQNVTVVDSSNRRRIILGLSDDGNPGVWIMTPQDTVAAEFGIGSQGVPAVWFYDKTGKERARMGFATENPGIRLYDPSGSVSWSAP